MKEEEKPVGVKIVGTKQRRTASTLDAELAVREKGLNVRLT